MPSTMSHDTDQHMVECSFIGDMADKAMDARDDASCQGNDYKAVGHKI